MFTIAKRFAFCASHALTTLPVTHKCHRLHGHNYVVEVVLAHPTLNPHGFVVDYGDLAPIREWINHTLDHQHLNDVLPSGTPPTAENLAAWLYDHIAAQFPLLSAIRVSETPDTWAEYVP